MTNLPEVIVVMGGQFGSEGKGDFIAWLVSQLRPFAVVRTGGPNAGHTMTLPNEEGALVKYAMRQLPCAWHVPNTLLIIGPGSIVDFDVLQADIELAISSGYINYPEILERLVVDGQATVLERRHREADSELVHRIGSTGKGVGGARADRIMRTAEIVAHTDNNFSASTSPLLGRAISRGGVVIIESPQGFGLSLHLSGHYPFTTSADLTPGHILGDAGISSRVPHFVIAVCRTFPIRVAGNSGPLYQESTWERLHELYPGIPTSGERTTVTKRLRRVGMFDIGAVTRMVNICRPDAICLTFLDYLEPEVTTATSAAEVLSFESLVSFIREVEEIANVPVGWVSVGPGRIIPLSSFW